MRHIRLRRYWKLPKRGTSRSIVVSFRTETDALSRKQDGENLFEKRFLPEPLSKNFYTPLASLLPVPGSRDANGI